MEDFVTELSAQDCYKGIDVLREWGKAMNWCRVNNRKATRRFFVNWLNKIDKPVPTQQASSPYKPYFEATPEPMSEKQRVRNLKLIKDMIETIRRGKQIV